MKEKAVVLLSSRRAIDSTTSSCEDPSADCGLPIEASTQQTARAKAIPAVSRFTQSIRRFDLTAEPLSPIEAKNTHV